MQFFITALKLMGVSVFALMLSNCQQNTQQPTSLQKDQQAGEAHINLPPPGTATSVTIAANNALAARLDLQNQRDFERAEKGFIGQIKGGTIYAADGRIVWDQSKFAFLNAPAPATANPSLWRQAQLNSRHGLFKVGKGIYQLRGYDLSVMTLIEGNTGWIVIDPLLTSETASAALGLARRHLGNRKVSAVIYSHSHADHFGGVRGILASEADAQSIPIIAPEHFDVEAIAENVLAGNHMARRAAYMFGANLPRSAIGVIDAGIGQTISLGTIGYVAPTEYVRGKGEEMLVDGVTMQFMNTPGTEAPSEFVFYLPDHKTLFSAELATGTLHNLLTPRGAQVRDALAWSKYLDQMIRRWGLEAELVISPHNWPRWGNDKVVTYLTAHRDIYQYLHNETLRLANHGHTIQEIGNLVAEPAFQGEEFSIRGYYGTLNHNSKAVYQRYYGWFDGVPAHLNALPAEEEAKRMVELLGVDGLYGASLKAFAKGDYRWSASLANHLVFARPTLQKAKDLLAASYEQMGYQAESAPWRNVYLAGAMELRNGISKNGPQTISRDFVEAIPTNTWFDAFSIRFNPAKAGDMDRSINFHLTDTNEEIGLKIANGVVNHSPELLPNADLDVYMSRADLNDITLGHSGFGKKLASGKIKVRGNPLHFIGYLKTHDEFDPHFPIVTP